MPSAKPKKDSARGSRGSREWARGSFYIFPNIGHRAFHSPALAPARNALKLTVLSHTLATPNHSFRWRGWAAEYCTVQYQLYSTVLKIAGARLSHELFPRFCLRVCSPPPASRFPHFASSKYDFGRSASSRDKWRHCYLMATAHLYLAIGRGMRYRRYLFSNGGERGASDCLRSLLRDEY